MHRCRRCGMLQWFHIYLAPTFAWIAVQNKAIAKIYIFVTESDFLGADLFDKLKEL